MDKTKRYEELCKLINKLNHEYYDLDNPSVSDYEYDLLMSELKEIEADYPLFISPDSPTQKVGGSAGAMFQKVAHAVQMGSLQDVFSTDELYDFDKRVRQTVDAEYVVEPKVDGLSVSLEYKNGRFIRGSTRGDGFIGEEITENLRMITNIPEKLLENISFIEVRGEVYMPHKSFNKLIEQQFKNNEQAFKNPRNAAAGTLRQKDNQVVKNRNLDIFIFNIQQIEGKIIESHIEALEFMKKLGFKVIEGYKLCGNRGSVSAIEKIIEYIEDIGKRRQEFPFDIDGAVVKVNNFLQREELGSTSKFPKWAVAFKYPPEEKRTVVTNIEVNVGRTGALTPLAVFEPILLSGSTVSRATLHNQDRVSQLDIRIGDVITVRKAGDIIPEVINVISHAEDSKPFFIPENCPACGSVSVRDADEAVVRCPNISCPAQLLRSIEHFASRGAMNIEGLGEAIVELLVSRGLVKTVADLYRLSMQDLLTLPNFKEKSAGNLLTAIEKSKENPLDKVIYALGIKGIGERNAVLLAEKFGHIDSIINAQQQEIAGIDKFGDVLAVNVFNAMRESHMIKLIGQLRELGLKMGYTKKQTGNSLVGLKFVITGTLLNLSRDQAKDLILANGGSCSDSVSKKTNYLLAGEAAGSKLKKANDLGVTVLNEEEFLGML